MSLRLEAIGFGKIEEENGLASALSLIARYSTESSAKDLICKPLDNCTVRLGLDRDAKPESLHVWLDSPLQPLLFGAWRPDLGLDAHCATCMDGAPVSPLYVSLDRQLDEPVSERIAFAELSGFCTSFQMSEESASSAGLERVTPDGACHLVCVLLGARKVMNKFTNTEVWTGSVWLPGAILPFACLEPVEWNPGTVLSGSVKIHARLADLL